MNGSYLRAAACTKAKSPRTGTTFKDLHGSYLSAAAAYLHNPAGARGLALAAVSSAQPIHSPNKIRLS
jgi:hypothetical protein